MHHRLVVRVLVSRQGRRARSHRQFNQDSTFCLTSVQVVGASHRSKSLQQIAKTNRRTGGGQIAPFNRCCITGDDGNVK